MGFGKYDWIDNPLIKFSNMLYMLLFIFFKGRNSLLYVIPSVEHSKFRESAFWVWVGYGHFLATKYYWKYKLFTQSIKTCNIFMKYNSTEMA